MAFYFGVLLAEPLLLGWSLDWFDGDKTASPAAVDEVHPTGNLGVEGVIFAPANIQAGLQLGATLAHDDGTTRDHLASKDFYAQSLSIGIATILGTT
jgi:hypothetical protein